VADDFAEDILGFEEVEEVEQEEGEGDMGNGATYGGNQGGSYSAGMGVIPEEN